MKTMNPRILELVNQSMVEHQFEHKFSPEKFAELIVRETVKEMSQQLYWHRMEQSNNPAYYKAIKKTLEHFGVEQ